jgi:hypothetical protein
MTFSRIALVHSGFALLRPVWRERPQNQGMAGRRTRNARFSMRNAAEKPVPGPATILMRRVPRRRNAPKRSETTVLETNVFGHFGQEDCVGLLNAYDLRSNSQSPSRAQVDKFWKPGFKRQHWTTECQNGFLRCDFLWREPFFPKVHSSLHVAYHRIMQESLFPLRSGSNRSMENSKDLGVKVDSKVRSVAKRSKT